MCSGELYIRLTERQRNAEGPGVSSHLRNAKVFRFHETILRFSEPGSLGYAQVVFHTEGR